MSETWVGRIRRGMAWIAYRVRGMRCEIRGHQWQPTNYPDITHCPKCMTARLEIRAGR